MKKLIPALALLLVSAVMLGTSSFAWFSMNTQVTVSGMSVTAKVGSNLAISTDTLSSTAKKTDSDFKNTLVQKVTGILEPVSTVNGTTFFYNSTKNAAGNGDAVTDTYLRYTEDGLAAAANTATYNNAFSENYSVAKSDTAVAYVEYVFQIKATNSKNVAQEIRLSQLDLTYGGAADTSKAWRVALFVEDITSANPAGTVGSLVTILTPSGAANHTANQAVNSTTTTAAVTYCANNTTAKFGSIAAGATAQYKVVLRLWLEGEDTTCTNSTFASLTDAWSLDAGFVLVESSAAASAVANINNTVTAAKTALLTSDTVAGEAAYSINGVDYYAITGKTLNTKQLYKVGSGALTTSDDIYVINNDAYVYVVTNQVSISEP